VGIEGTPENLASEQPAAPGPIQMSQGRCFQFAVPYGWRVLEEGQHAVVLCAPDNTAVTIMIGNCGFPPGSDPMAYAREKLSTLGVQDLQLGQPRPGRPQPGFAGAYEVDCSYAANGVPCRGVATVSVRSGYGTVDLVLTCAAAQAASWPEYASWLPGVAAHVVVTDGAAYGARALAQQNLSNSMAFGQQLQAHREHSHQLQQALADQRERSDEIRTHERGEVLTGQSWYPDPQGNPPQRLSTSAAVYWVNPQGEIRPSDDPNYDPRTSEDPYWQRMAPQPP